MSFCFNIRHLIALNLAIPLLALGQQSVSFKADLAPILLNQCQSCHGPKKAKGDYRVDTFERAMEAGFDELHYRITTDDEDDIMPPDADPLSKAQIALFKRWQKEGAVFDGKDPNASLAEIIPGRKHPDPPEVYPRAIPITALAFADDGGSIFVSGYREVTVWSVTSGALQSRIKGLPERIHSIDLDSEGNRLLIAGGSPGRFGEVRVINLLDGSLIHLLHKSEDLCLSAKFSPDKTRLATCGTDGTVRVYDSESGKQLITFANHSNWVNDLAWSGDSTKIVTGSRDRTAKVFNLADRKRLSSYTGHDGSVYSVMFDQSGKHIYSASGDGKLLYWRSADGHTVRELFKQDEAIYKIAKPSNRETLIVTGAARPIKAVSLSDYRIAKEYPCSGSQVSLAISTDHKLLAAGDPHGGIKIYELDSGEPVAEFSVIPGLSQ